MGLLDDLYDEVKDSRRQEIEKEVESFKKLYPNYTLDNLVNFLDENDAKYSFVDRWLFYEILGF